LRTIEESLSSRRLALPFRALPKIRHRLGSPRSRFSPAHGRTAGGRQPSWALCPFSARGTRDPDKASLPHPLRSALGVSHALGGLIPLALPGLFHPGGALGISPSGPFPGEDPCPSRGRASHAVSSRSPRVRRATGHSSRGLLSSQVRTEPIGLRPTSTADALLAFFPSRALPPTAVDTGFPASSSHALVGAPGEPDARHCASECCPRQARHLLRGGAGPSGVSHLVAISYPYGKEERFGQLLPYFFAPQIQ
jgi:hypothetical protein